MPIHDWTRVDAGIFHHFHLEWIGEIARVLNAGLLPPDHYALAEQITGSWEPDVLTLRGPTGELPPDRNPPVGVAVAVGANNGRLREYSSRVALRQTDPLPSCRAFR